jgi:hypothetical protein
VINSVASILEVTITQIYHAAPVACDHYNDEKHSFVAPAGQINCATGPALKKSCSMEPDQEDWPWIVPQDQTPTVQQGLQTTCQNAVFSTHCYHQIREHSAYRKANSHLWSIMPSIVQPGSHYPHPSPFAHELVTPLIHSGANAHGVETSVRLRSVAQRRCCLTAT